MDLLVNLMLHMFYMNKIGNVFCRVSKIEAGVKETQMHSCQANQLDQSCHYNIR